MTQESDRRGIGVEISAAPVEGAGAVSQADGISECRPPLGDAQPNDSRPLAPEPRTSSTPLDLESILEWARRAAEDRTEVSSLLDELDPRELRALAARLAQLVGLLELCPADVDPMFFIARLTALAGDFADDPWTRSEADR